MKKEEQSFGCGISMSQKGHALSGWILRIVPLFAMLFVTVVAKAAGDGDGVKFNPGVRYSQWAINSRLHDFYGNTKLFGFDVYDANNTMKSKVQWKNGSNNINKSFDYVAGLVAKATLEAADYYAGFDWSKPWFYSAQAFAAEVTYSNDSKPTLDAMNAVKMYFPILSSSLKSDNVVTKANTALANLANDMKNYNTNYSIGGSKSTLNEGNASDAQKQMFGGWFHKSSDYVDQMWLDGAYMGSATLAQLTGYLGDSKNIFGSKEADWNMVAKQLNIVWNQCWDSNKQLMYHAFSATGDAKASTETNKTWAGISNSADAPVYHSAAFWGRANSWYFFALVDALEAMKNDKQENTENYKTLKSHLDSFAAGIVKWQDQTTGGWYQVMDEKGDYKASNYNSSYRWTTSYNNYIETSATAIFSASLFKAVRLGLLGDTYKEAAKKAFEGIVNNFVAPKADGTINIWSSSRSAGLGGKYYRDGSKDYYILGTDTKIVTKEDNLTEGKVLGGFIMAATEYERAYQNQDGSAQILFSYDLKPAYDLTQSDATAPKVEVCGTDAANATYQWYNATTNAAVKGAKEASFTPSATGNYYCKATVDGTSIQTSTTNIKVNNTGGGETGGETTTETVFSYDVPASGELSTTDTNEGVTGGKIMFASKTNAGGKYKIDNDTKKYVKVTLSGNSLKAGDVISVKASASNSGYGCFAALDTDKKTTLKLGNLTGDGPEDISYTVTEKDILNGQSSFYLFRETGKSIYVHSITITRKTTTQTTSPLVIAVENVEMNVTDEETLQPEVKVYGIGDKQLSLGTDYKLSFSTDNNNVTINENGVVTAAGSKSNYTEGVTHVTVTATPSAELAGQYTEATETFTFTVRKGKMKPVFMPAYKGATIKVATGTKKTIEVPLNYRGEDVSGYFDVKYSCSGLSGLTSSDNKMTYKFNTVGTYTITVSATPKIINQGKDDEFNYADEYDTPDNVTFTVDVNSYTVPKVILDPSTDKTIYVGQVVDAPAVSVTDAQGTAIDKSKYTLEWTSFAPDVCKVDATTGKIEGVSAGDKLKIQLKVSGDGFEDVFSYILVSVDDPAKYRVKATGSGEKYSPMTPLFNQNKTLAVTLGGWSFTDRDTAPVSKEGLTYGDKNKWADDSSKATWVIKGFDYYLPGLTCQNARQEDGACPLPSETQWYDGKLQKVEGSTVDPMFYVPCSGAYLTVEPKTNGKVSVSVFQNGVFDKSGGVYAYRPQRRVFVLDEAGKVVASEATISATGGKLTVADKNATGDLKDPYKITNYPCNITGLASGTETDGGKSGATKYPSPTENDVKNHFRGMTSFEMSASGFQNNVYESNIDNTTTWGDNATPNNGADDNVKGSHGWSVLVDAAVTYTFDVKAGKTYYIYNYGSKLGFYGFSFDEAKGQTVKYYEFDEADANTIELTKAGELSTAKVNRAMKAGVWTTCVLPFSLNKQQVDAIFGKTYDRDTPNGTQILYFDRVEGTKAIFVRHAYNNIVAGKPFLIKPAQDVASINTAEVEGYPYVTIENTQPAEWCKGNGYVWMASYNNDLTVKEGDCFISNKDGSFKNFVGDPGTLKGFRGYLKNIGTNGVSEAKKLTVGIGSNVTTEETSAIDGILIDGDMPADSVTAADGKVYNLNGQVVATSYRQFQALPGGVYVVNGKKVVK